MRANLPFNECSMSSIALEARSLVRDAACPVTPGETVKAQMRRAWDNLGCWHWWRVRAAWNGEAGCWSALLLYPITPGTIFLAKTAANLVALCLIDAVLVVAFTIFSDVPLLTRPIAFAGVVLLANLAFVDDRGVRDQAILGVLGGSLIALVLSAIVVTARARSYRRLAAAVE